MPADPFTKWLWDGRRSLAGWTVAIVAVGGFYAAFWPTVNDPQLQAALENYPEALLDALNFTDISTAAGYLNASVYGLVVAVLLIVYAVAAGTRLVAGDEEAGTLDLVLAHPVGRSRLALQRFGAFTVAVAAIDLVLLAVMAALTVPVGLDGISIGGYAAMHLHLFLFGVLFGAVAFAVGAATGSRGRALAAGSGVAVVGFIANGVIAQVEGLEWMQRVSPFQWLNGDNPLRNGVHPGYVLLMAALATILVAAGTWAFGRRDVAV